MIPSHFQSALIASCEIWPSDLPLESVLALKLSTYHLDPKLTDITVKDKKAWKMFSYSFQAFVTLSNSLMKIRIDIAFCIYQ